MTHVTVTQDPHTREWVVTVHADTWRGESRFRTQAETVAYADRKRREAHAS